MAEYDAPLVHLPGTVLTPEVVLHRTLNKVHHIKAVSIVIQWNDDTFVCDWSKQTTLELVTAATALRIEAERQLQSK